jgi:hypothetical protein
VRRRLCRVDDRQRAHLVRPGDDALHRIDGAHRVRLVDERDDPGAFVDDLVDGGVDQAAVVVDRDPPEGRAGTQRQLLPRDEIAVMLHLRDHDLVTRAQPEPLRAREG